MMMSMAEGRAWAVVEPLIKVDGSVLAVIEDEVLRDADVTSSNVLGAVAAMMGNGARIEAIEIGLPGNSRPGFLLMVPARPSPSLDPVRASVGLPPLATSSWHGPGPVLRVFSGSPPPAGVSADVRDLIAEIPLPTPGDPEAVRTPGANAAHDTIGPVDETKFKRLEELISIARWHIRFGDRDHRTKVVEEAEIELRFARRESDMLAEQLAKPRIETRAELIAKLAQKAARKFEQASRIAMRALRNGEAVPETARTATQQALALESIVRDLKNEIPEFPESSRAN